jgi:peptidoglycan hydrolase-like protein with peptidoglycan-binding domain
MADITAGDAQFTAEMAMLKTNQRRYDAATGNLTGVTTGSAAWLRLQMNGKPTDFDSLPSAMKNAICGAVPANTQFVRDQLAARAGGDPGDLTGAKGGKAEELDGLREDAAKVTPTITPTAADTSTSDRVRSREAEVRELGKNPASSNAELQRQKDELMNEAGSSSTPAARKTAASQELAEVNQKLDLNGGRQFSDEEVKKYNGTYKEAPKEGMITGGMKGDRVSEWQSMLAKNGYNLRQDGFAGPEFENRVAAFQRANGITNDPDGSKTEAALRKGAGVSGQTEASPQRPSSVPMKDAPGGIPTQTPAFEARVERPSMVPMKDAPGGIPTQTPAFEAKVERPSMVPMKDAPGGIPTDSPAFVQNPSQTRTDEIKQAAASYRGTLANQQLAIDYSATEKDPWKAGIRDYQNVSQLRQAVQTGNLQAIRSLAQNVQTARENYAKIQNERDRQNFTQGRDLLQSVPDDLLVKAGVARLPAQVINV